MLGRARKSPSQPGEVHVQAVAGHHRPLTPAGADEFLAGDDLPVPLGEIPQEQEFHRGNEALCPVHPNPGGGPVNASNTMATYMVDWGFRRSQLGYGSATAVILFSAALVVALLYQRFVMRRDIDGAITTTGG